MTDSNSDTYGPISFQKYVAENCHREVRTAPCISVDSLNRLPSELLDSGVMVFRLGTTGGARHTSFALARTQNGWRDYFLLDEELFSSTPPEIFIPTVPARHLIAFQLLPKLTETSFVNLGLASGLLGTALGLDEPATPIIPATGQSTFTFDFCPHPTIGTTWRHNAGQVEIDAIFIARRNGKEVLFVVEAKTSQRLGTLAKHKLAYPVFSLRTKATQYLEIVPVYVRILKVQNALHFFICEMQIAANVPPDLSSLAPRSQAKQLVMHWQNQQ